MLVVPRPRVRARVVCADQASVFAVRWVRRVSRSRRPDALVGPGIRPREGTTMEIRQERPDDIDVIRQITTAAFAPIAHSRQTEAAVVDALRSAGALTLSLVAVVDGAVVEHVAFSPVTINGAGTCSHATIAP
jgi:hypothetical protein